MSIKDRGSKRGSIRKKKTSEMLILRGLSYHLFSLSGAYGNQRKTSYIYLIFTKLTQ
jgi:hypothetical protein